MKEYEIIVTQTDTYKKSFTIKAKSAEEAEKIIQEELDACPLDTQSNTFQSSEFDYEVKK